jgi:hypothetical protein
MIRLLLLLLLLLRWKRRKIGVAAIIHDDVLERCCSDKLATNLENEETVADCKLLFEVSMHARRKVGACGAEFTLVEGWG